MNKPKIILMPLGQGGQAQERLNCALLMAKRFDAHVRVLHTGVDPHPLIPEETFVMSSESREDMQQAFEQHADEESQPLHELFLKSCQRHAIDVVDDISHPGPCASWLEEEGLRSALVSQYGKIADLTLLPRPHEGKPTATFEAAALETGRPVLVVPRRLPEFKPDTVTIAWNCTAETSRSLADAMPLLQQAKRVIIASAGSCAKRNPTPNQAAAYLENHGITAEVDIFDRDDGRKGKALLTSAKANQSDLIVLGAYSKSRLEESIFGGVTRYMLAHAQMPLFFSH